MVSVIFTKRSAVCLAPLMFCCMSQYGSKTDLHISFYVDKYLFSNLMSYVFIYFLFYERCLSFKYELNVSYILTNVLI